MEHPEATVVWYQERFSRGVVRLDSGRQYMFTKTKELEDIQARLRVCVLHEKKGSAGIVVTGLPDGRREFAPEPPPLPPKRSKNRRSKATSEPGLPIGTSVVHKSYGQGFVVSATARMARVRFTDSEEERSVRIAGLEVLAEA